MNQDLKMRKDGRDAVKIYTLYRLLEVLSFSHRTELSSLTVLDMLSKIGLSAQSFEKVRFMQNHLYPYPPNHRPYTIGGKGTWLCIREKTEYLEEFQMMAFREVKNVLLVPLHQKVTFG